ncbi:MAG: hypothetical protein ACRBCK_01650 [Alphaproteobacteria bacterium]
MKGDIKQKRFFKRWVHLCLSFLLVVAIATSVLVFQNKNAEAICPCCPTFGCNIVDTIISPIIWTVFEDGIWDGIIEDNIEDHLNEEENWIVEEFFEDFWLPGLAELTEFLGAFGMYQVEMVGTFFDAKNQLETERLFFQLQAEAHKDYHPSDDFCWFGTGSRSLAATESRANLNALALSEKGLQRQLGYAMSTSATNLVKDQESRWNQFVETYCDPKDNGWTETGTGLDFACDRDGLGPSAATGATNRRRVNKDIDYTRLIDEPRTLDINFSDFFSPAPGLGITSDDEEDVMAMSSRLYGTTLPSRSLSNKALLSDAGQRLYMDLRSVVAKRSVAQHSFNSIVAMKSAGTNGTVSTPANTGTYLAAVLKDLMPAGTPDSEIYEVLGENPSYYAQLEVLGKKIYQNPDFFANLYDKPANVKRKSVAMKAINLMLDRALYESELRQEMLLSVMLASKMKPSFRNINKTLKIVE